MAKRKNYTRKKRRGYAVRPRHRMLTRGTRLVVGKPIGGLPRYQPVKLCYSESVKCAGAGSADSYMIYKLNSIFDPQDTLGPGWANNSNGNTQPLYRDQWATLYDQYRVLGAKYIIRCYVGDDSGTVISNMRVVVWPSDTQTSGSAAILVDAERPYVKQTMCSSGARQNSKISFYCPTYLSASATRSQVKNDDAFASTMGTNPTRITYLNIRNSALNPLLGTTNISLYMDIKIIYYTILFNRIDVSGS